MDGRLALHRSTDLFISNLELGAQLEVFRFYNRS
jgi:hypothetical protein